MNANNKLSDKEIKYFYQLLFRYETVIKKDCKNYNFNSKEVKKILREKSITLNYNGKVKEHSDKNYIIFTTSQSICVDFIRHIRNAFAHGLIFKKKNYYIIQDIYKNNYTMYGQISLNLLPDLIETLENTKKNKFE